MSLRFQNFNRIFEFLLFVKQVNYGVAGETNSEKIEFLLDFNEIMENKNLSKEEKKGNFLIWYGSIKKYFFNLADLFDFNY